jgi:hypothetical protein
MISDIRACPTLELEKILTFIKKTYNEKQIDFMKRKEKYDFAISGFGPKIQNVAICFFALRNKNIQLVYGAPSYWGASLEAQKELPVESKGIGGKYVYGPFSMKSIDNLFE